MSWIKVQIDYLYKNYELGNPRIVAKVLFKPYGTVVSMANRLGLKNKTKYDRISLNNKSINVHFFDTWSHDMAYILGFLFSDGGVISDYVFKLELRRSDREILEKIKIAMDSRFKVTDYYKKGNFIKSGKDKGRFIKGGWSSNAQFSSKYMVSKLFEYGLGRRKSLCENFPIVPLLFLPDFLRGYWDGDGSICYKINPSGNSMSLDISFHGSDHTMLKIQVMLDPMVRGGSIHKDSGIFKLVYGKHDSIALLDWFYSTPSSLYLLRKFKKYMDFLNEQSILKVA